MKRSLALAFAVLTVTGCYTPKGSFILVDDFPLPPQGDYLISPGDTLQVRVFQQDAMSATVRVRTDGKVSLPMVNDVVAAGKTLAALAAELQLRLKDFMNIPVVTVSLEGIHPLLVSVLGEVKSSGPVTLEPGAGLLQAIAAAGGLTDFAHGDGIFVLRRLPGDSNPTRIRFAWERLTRGDGNSARFTLQPGDVVVVE